MKYLKLFLVLIILLGFSHEGFSVQEKQGKRDIIAERLKHPQHHSSSSRSKGSSHKKSGKKQEEPKKEEAKKEEPKKSDKKKSDKESDDKKKEDEKKEEKPKNQKKESKKPSKKNQGPRRYFLSAPPEPLPVPLHSEQDRQIELSVQSGKIEEALNYYRQTGASLKLVENQDGDELDSKGLSRGTAGVQLLRYLELKKDKKPFTVISDSPQHLETFLQNHSQDLWISRQGDKMKISFKGNLLAKGEKLRQKRDFAIDSLKQMICTRVLKGRKIPIEFRLRSEGKVAAYFQERENAEMLADYVNGSVVEEAGLYSVALEGEMCKRIIPVEGKKREILNKVMASLQKEQKSTAVIS